MHFYKYSTSKYSGMSVDKPDGTHIFISADGTLFNNKNNVSVTFPVLEQGDIGIELKLFDAILDIKLEKGSIPTPYTEYNNNYITINTQNKNLLNTSTLLPNNATNTHLGVNYYLNNNGSVTVDGNNTSGSTSYYVVCSASGFGYNTKTSFSQKSKLYLRGCPKGGGPDKYWLQLWNEDGTKTVRDYGDGVEYIKLNNSNWNVAICIANGFNANNLTFKPMLTELPNTEFEKR